MPMIRRWTLPLNPPNPYQVYLQSLAPILPGERSLFYSKYILGVVGELDLFSRKDNVREWKFPAALNPSPAAPFSNLMFLERGPRPDHLWFAINNWHGAIGEMQPGNGLFTVHTTPSAAAPLIHPRRSRLDGRGNLWFVGFTAAARSTISRFDTATRSLVYWTIPQAAMLNVYSIAPDEAGDRVWVSCADANYGSTRQWIGELDVASGKFSCFSPTPYLDSPCAFDIVRGAVPNTGSIWFTAASLHGEGAVFRLDLASMAFELYRTVSTSCPGYVVLDSKGSAWVTDYCWKGVVFCSVGSSCGTVPFRGPTFRLRPRQQHVSTKELRVAPTVSTAPFQDEPATVKTYPCARKYQIPLPSSPNSVQVVDSRPGHPQVFFVNWGRNQVVRLQP